MTYSTENIEDFFLPMPITQAAQTIAQQFANQQPNSQKAEQVKLNTLAICAVNDYLQLVGISTKPTAGDSWNSFVRLYDDVADLEITQLGRLECRPIKPEQQACYVPLEVWSNRIGYVIVQIDESLQEATILGFTKTVSTTQLSINQLQPLEDLLEHLSQLRQLVRLSEWFQNIFEAGWQAVKELFSTEVGNPAFSVRSPRWLRENDAENPAEEGVSGGKLIDLGMQLAGNPVALVVTLTPAEADEEDEEVNIRLRVYPTGKQIYLPPNLQLIVLDESGTTIPELLAQARSVDNWIQLEFGAKPGERFSIRVTLGDVSITENFVA